MRKTRSAAAAFHFAPESVVTSSESPSSCSPAAKQPAAVGHSEPSGARPGVGLLPQGWIEDQRHHAADGDFHRPEIALDPQFIAGQGLGVDQSGQLIAVVQDQAVGLARLAASDAVEKCVASGRGTAADGRRCRPGHPSGKLDPAQKGRVEREFRLVGLREGGRQQTAVGQAPPPAPCRGSTELTPGNQVGQCEAPRLATGVEAELPLGIDAR